MLPFAYYLLKITICSAVLFGYYWFLLRNKVFHGYNRFYLLAIVGLSICLPLCRINIFAEKHAPQTSVIKMLQVVTDGDEYMDEVIIGGTKQSSISAVDFLPFIYALVSFVLLVLLIQMLFTIFLLAKKHTHTKIEHIHFINTEAAKGTPFSFFKYIFWNNQINLQSPEGTRIFKHELAHIQALHSWDKMFINLVLVLFWSNPIFWLIHKELSMIHEFIADKKAVEDGDTAAFAAMILATTYPQHNITIANNFFYSPIKRRLMMLTKKTDKTVSYISRLLVLPVLVIVFAAFTMKAKQYNDTIINKENKVINVVIDAGHGGTDPGAINVNGVSEKDMALVLAKKVKELNKDQNINIILSRETDVFNNVKEKAEFANNQKADLFISIHLSGNVNKINNKSSGLEIYVSRDSFPNSQESKMLGASILKAFINNYAIPVIENLKQRQAGIWVLQSVNAPSVLIEAGYITTDKDLAYLQSEKGQMAFASNVLNGINNFLNNKKAAALDNKNSLGEEDDRKKIVGYLENMKITNDNYAKVNASEYLHTFKNDLEKKQQSNTTESYTDLKSNNFKDNLENQKENDKRVYKNQHNLTFPDIRYLIDSPKNRVLFTKTEKKPEFSGGADAWRKFLQTNLKTTTPIEEGWKPGKYVVMVKFIVEADGSVTNVTTDNYVNSKTAKACIDLIKSGPKWKPALQNGHIVACVHKQPITFIVNDADSPVQTQKKIELELGNTNGGKIKLEDFKKFTSIKIMNGLELVSTNIYFGGAGFQNVAAGTLNGNSLAPIQMLLDKCMAGTSITFTNIKVKTKDGIRTIDEVTFYLF